MTGLHALVVALLFLAGNPGEDKVNPSPAAAADHAAAAPESSAERMVEIYRHLSPHAYYHDADGKAVPYLKVGSIEFTWQNHHLAILVACGLVFLAFGWLAYCRRRSLHPVGPLQNLLEAMVIFVRDDMVYETMGKHYGRRFLPLFLSQFFCILTMNLFGILPNFDFARSMHFPTTATANVMVTGGLALVTLTVMLVAGMREQGVFTYWKNLAPHVDLGDAKGMKFMKIVILAILYPIEGMGLLIKPLALTIRLFANMTGGHLAMLTVYGLIYMFNSYSLAGVGVAFNVFLTFLETLVAFIQAYIFTYLSILFVGASVHPDH